jgi:hypothetical protein
MTARFPSIQQFALALLCAAAVIGPALAGVRILDTAPQAPAPLAPTPPPSEPVTAAPGVELGKDELKADNPAGLSIEILPRADLPVGAHVTFKVTSRKRGYLMLVDVDAAGKLTQIYPNQNSLTRRVRDNSNLIRPGRAVMVPDKDNPLAGFEFVASPPEGVAMIVAVLSDRAVQVIDLPDVPRQFTGQAAALDYLTALAKSLRIPDESGDLEEAKWSFDAKFYRIR